eukprot:265253-Pleurochrysis_carterae.AAC.1
MKHTNGRFPHHARDNAAMHYQQKKIRASSSQAHLSSMPNSLKRSRLSLCIVVRKVGGTMRSSKRKQVARPMSSCRTHEQWRGAAIAAAATGLQSCGQSVQYSTHGEPACMPRRARGSRKEIWRAGDTE